jgi:hypothetical protein
MATADYYRQNSDKLDAENYARKGWGVVEEPVPEEKPKEIKKVVAPENFEILISNKDQEKIDKRRIDDDKRKIQE